MSDNDRRVHGNSKDGLEIVRYDRAGKWYLEHPEVPIRWLVTVGEAAANAAAGEWYPNLLGGSTFDRKVREARR